LPVASCRLASEHCHPRESGDRVPKSAVRKETGPRFRGDDKCTVGAFLVSSELNNWEVKFVKIVSEKGRECVVVIKAKGERKVKGFKI